MSIASHLSVYLRYLDSINRPLLQYIIELFNEKLSSNIQYVFIMEVRCPLLVHLSVYLRYLDSINRPLLQYIIELINEIVIFKHSISIRDGG